MSDRIDVEQLEVKAHAKFSASGSSRWINCPASIKAEEHLKNTSSIYALEGTIAHELADVCLKADKDAKEFIGEKTIPLVVDDPKVAAKFGQVEFFYQFDHNGDEVECYRLHANIDREMANYVQQYLDYVRAHIDEDIDAELMTEQTVFYPQIAPGNFGTLDCAVMLPNKRQVHIFDLKYGKGVSVYAEENTQAQTYATGLDHTVKNMRDDYDTITIHIAQPRTHNFSTWEITWEQLDNFIARAHASYLEACGDNPSFNPSEKTCMWCKAKADCVALANHLEDTILLEFDELPGLDADEIQAHAEVLSDEQICKILENEKLLLSFIDALHLKINKRVLNGENVEGFKIIRSRSTTRWVPDAEIKLLAMLDDDQIYNKKLIGVTEAKALLTDSELAELTFKQQGAIKVVPESMKGKALSLDELNDVSDAFEDLGAVNEDPL